MVTNAAGLATQNESERPGTPLTWGLAILACAYIGWNGYALYVYTDAFSGMFSSMGVELPIPTRIVISSYRFFYPLLFGGALGVVIAKQFYVRQKWANLTTTLAAVVVVVVFSNEIVRALYRPLLDLMEKLNR